MFLQELAFLGILYKTYTYMKKADKIIKNTSKKKLILLGVVVALVVTVLATDFGYRNEFREFEEEADRIASFLPEGTVEDKTDQSKKGNGLLGRLHCFILGFGMPCPIVGSDFLIPTTSDESMRLAQKVSQDSGYEIESDDLPGTIGGDCILKLNRPCTLSANNGKYFVLIWQTVAEDGSISWRLSVQPSLK